MARQDDIRDENGRLLRELHGVTLAAIVEYLVAHLGWEALGERVPVNCFTSNPSVKSSLTFLRRTPWARTKVEQLYIELRSRELQTRG
ncbi:hypothetical protein AKJ09_10510 [Labilithrix luteola]|uniref:Transporter n=1 Tax=Labilithrix luteola TaxID=1391654 RepID=A0A0K1QDW5_9BACT|nr:VF530 family protein [Labilithrix luteola]AKV03847.1 hypothetical protein AKJ09_10510 [Labilithrix luteola]